MRADDPALNLRLECETDGAFLAALFRSTCAELLQLDLPEAMREGLIELQYRAQQTAYRNQFPAARHQILEATGEPIGAQLVHRGSREIRLVYVALLPQARRRGYGRRLIEMLQAEAAEADKPLTLSVARSNWPAQRLYASTGFQTVPDDKVNMEMVWRPAPEGP